MICNNRGTATIIAKAPTPPRFPQAFSMLLLALLRYEGSTAFGANILMGLRVHGNILTTLRVKEQTASSRPRTCFR